MDKIAGIASIQTREESLKETVRSLYNQVDVICIYLNDYKKVPKFLIKEKIKVYRGNDLTDLGKFYGLYFHKGYYFSCDDDLIYPPDYVEYMTEKIDQYDCIVSCHGRIFMGKIGSYYRNGIKFHCLQEVGKDKLINVGGTGVMGFKTSIGFDLDQIPKYYPCMADVHIGVWANGKIPIRVVAHEKGWLKLTDADMRTAIYERFKNNDQIQTKLCQIKWV